MPRWSQAIEVYVGTKKNCFGHSSLKNPLKRLYSYNWHKLESVKISQNAQCVTCITLKVIFWDWIGAFVWVSRAITDIFKIVSINRCASHKISINLLQL